MHYSWDENYERGYEWWLMVEAKKVKLACHHNQLIGEYKTVLSASLFNSSQNTFTLAH